VAGVTKSKKLREKGGILRLIETRGGVGLAQKSLQKVTIKERVTCFGDHSVNPGRRRKTSFRKVI